MAAVLLSNTYVSPGSNGEGIENRVLASERLVRSPGPVDTERRALHSNSGIFTSSFRPEGIWDLYFR